MHFRSFIEWLNRPRRDFVVLLLSGPITGQTLCNRVYHEAIKERFPIRTLDLGPGNKSSRLLVLVTKVLKSLRAAIAILASLRYRASFLYMGAQANWGIATDCVIAAAARLRRITPVIHHHTYNYITIYDRRMMLLVWIAGKNAVHVVLCRRMASEFVTKYGECKTLVVPNPDFFDAPLTDSTSALNHRFVIGHISNLTMEKGLAEVIETFTQLARLDCNIELHLAGPLQSAAERSLVDSTLEKHGQRIRYFGPVYGHDKVAFYRGIRVMLFPTKYKNESWGMVLNEAMVCGVPVIASDRGCISHVLGDSGVLVSNFDKFVDTAVVTIQKWLREPLAYGNAVDSATRRGRELRVQAVEGSALLMSLLSQIEGR